MADFNPFDIGAWLTPTPEQARMESIQLQKEQTKYLRRIAESRDSSAVSPVTYELAQSVSGFVDGLAGLGYGLDRAADLIGDLRIDVQKGFAGLGALFDWRMASVISLLEQQQTTLYEIRDLLRYPRKTAANEDKEDARQAVRVAFNSLDAARRQWLERALNFCRAAAEKNPFDYTVHLDMGTLLLEAYGQPDAALPCCPHRADGGRPRIREQGALLRGAGARGVGASRNCAFCHLSGSCCCHHSYYMSCTLFLWLLHQMDDGLPIKEGTCQNRRAG